MIGALRINSLSEVAYRGEVTFGVGSKLMWAVAQLSTGIIVACCPHLRPLFEKVVPFRLTRMTTRTSQTPRRRRSSIVVTTRIEIEPASSAQPPPASFHDGFLEPWGQGPKFDVVQSPATSPRDISCCCGGSVRRCACFG